MQSNKSIVQSLAFKLHGLVMMMDKELDSVLHRELNLSYSQFLLLFLIDHKKISTQKSISAVCNITEAAVSKQVEVLRKDGFLTRVENPKDRRQHNLELTNLGLDVLKNALVIVDSMVKDLFQVISPDEEKEMEQIVEKLFNRIRKNSENEE